MVSAIITTHNRKELLAKAVQSVLGQTYKDIELIVVSDGSTDGTDELMKRFESNEQVKYINYNPGRGGNYARNIGIKAATGDYIAFLDDDDIWYPMKIEKQAEILVENEDIGLVYTGLKSIYLKENLSYIYSTGYEGDASVKILMGNFIGTTSTVMVRRKILDLAGYFDESLKAQQDYDLWIRICQICKVGFVSEPMIDYFNITNTNQMSDKTILYENSIKYLNEKYSSLYNRLSDNQKKQLYVNNCINIAKKHLRNGNASTGRTYIVNALKTKISLSVILTYFSSFLSFKNILKIKKFINSIQN